MIFFTSSLGWAPMAQADVLENIQTKALCAIHSKKCPDTAKSLPSTLKTALFACEAVAKSEFCQELVRKEPEFYGRTKRCELENFCSDHLTQELDSLKMCGQGFLEGTGETIAGAIDLLKGAWSNIEKQNKLIAVCNQSVECKREMVQGIPKFQKLSDEQLNKFSAAALKVELDNFTYNQSVIALQSVKTKTLSERAEEAERRQSTASTNSEGSEKRMLAGVKQWLKNKGARLECLDTKTQAEMICWGAAAIIDPLVVAGAAAKGIQAARYLKSLGLASNREIPLAMMQSESRAKMAASPSAREIKAYKDAKAKDEALLKKLREPGVDQATLRRHVNHVWSDPKISVKEKISETFEEYIQLRSNDLSSEKKRKAQEALANIKRTQDNNAGYYPVENEIRVGDALTDDTLSYYQVVVHEFEHLTQDQMKYLNTNAKAKTLQERLTALVKKSTDEPKLGTNKNYHMEFEAIGAQWDFLQAIPEEVRKQSVQKIKANRALSPELKEAMVKDLEFASLSREDFLRVVPKYHAYSHLNDAKWDSGMSVVMRNAAIGATAIGIIGGAAEYLYNK